MNRRLELRDHAVFGQKLLKTQRSVGRCTHKSPVMKWANALSLQKNSLKLNAASHNNASWSTDPDGFLGHSPGRGSLSYKGPALQKIIPGFFGSPLVHRYKWSSTFRIINSPGEGQCSSFCLSCPLWGGATMEKIEW